jgi:hypothetical protein
MEPVYPLLLTNRSDTWALKYQTNLLRHIGEHRKVLARLPPWLRLCVSRRPESLSFVLSLVVVLRNTWEVQSQPAAPYSAVLAPYSYSIDGECADTDVQLFWWI